MDSRSRRLFLLPFRAFFCPTLHLSSATHLKLGHRYSIRCQCKATVVYFTRSTKSERLGMPMAFSAEDLVLRDRRHSDEILPHFPDLRNSAQNPPLDNLCGPRLKEYYHFRCLQSKIAIGRVAKLPMQQCAKKSEAAF